jgi:CMP-N-acetylneuraminic acid synthetase
MFSQVPHDSKRAQLAVMSPLLNESGLSKAFGQVLDEARTERRVLSCLEHRNGRRIFKVPEAGNEQLTYKRTRDSLAWVG